MRRWYRRVYFTEDEIAYLIDIVDVWIESHKESAEDDDVEDDEIEGLFDNMARAIDVRDKLWRQLSGRE
jgi:hypothetical protein